MHSWWESQQRGRAGLPVREGENMSAYYSGQGQADVGAGGLAVVVVVLALGHAAYLLISGPLLYVVISGAISAVLTIIALGALPLFKVSMPIPRLTWNIVCAFAAGLLTTLAMLALGSALYHLANISLLSYVADAYTDEFGQPSDTPRLMVFDPSLPAYWLNFLSAWAATTWMARKRVGSNVPATSGPVAVLKIAGLIGASFYMAWKFVT